MSKPAVSIFTFGVYLLSLGIILVAVPNFLLKLFSLPTTSEVWIRVVGMLVIFLGVYDVVAARYEMLRYLQWSVYVRSSSMVFFIAFVLLGFVQPQLILFGIVDLLGAIWTALALKASTPRLNPTQ